MTAATALLVATTLEALEKGTTDVTTKLVKMRLLEKDELMEDGELKPFVELVLRAVRDIAKSTAPSTDKHIRITEMLLLGGF